MHGKGYVNKSQIFQYINLLVFQISQQVHDKRAQFSVTNSFCNSTGLNGQVQQIWIETEARFAAILDAINFF